MKIARFLCFLTCFLLPAALFSQPALQWQSRIGGDSMRVQSMDLAHNEGYIFGGTGGAINTKEAWVIKTDDTGKVLWEKRYGGSGLDQLWYISSTTDGGYIFTGMTGSTDGDLTGIHTHHGNGDVWVVKIDSIGTIQWQKTYGGSLSDVGRIIKQTPNGEYLVAAQVLSNDGDVTGNRGGVDFWVIKLDDTGKILWQKAMGSSGLDAPYDMVLTAEGGCFVVGEARWNDGDVSQGIPGNNWWMVKLSSAGAIEWEKTHSGMGAGNDIATSVSRTMDGGYIVLGQLWNTMNNPGVHHGLLKLDASGMVQWSKPINALIAGLRGMQAIIQTADSGYLVLPAEKKPRFPGDNSYNYYILKLDAQGDSVWSKVLGGTKDDVASLLMKAPDGGYVIAGFTESDDGDVAGNPSEGRNWIIKLAPPPTTNAVLDNAPSRIEVYPNPTHDVVYFSEQIQVQVQDVLGRVIEEKKQTRSVSLKDKRKGLYLFQFYDQKGRVIGSRKILKQ